MNIIYSGNNLTCNLENTIGLNILCKILNEMYDGHTRFEGIDSNIPYSDARMHKIPNEYYKLFFMFNVNKKDATKTSKYITNEIENIAKGDTKLDDANIENIKKELISENNSELKTNHNLILKLEYYYTKGINYTKYEETIANIDSKKIIELAKKIIEANNILTVIANPED